MTANSLSPAPAAPQETALSVPDWVHSQRPNWGEKVHCGEWEDTEQDQGYREKNGWKGRDLIHDKHAAVRITEYFVQYGTGNIGPASSPASPAAAEGQQTQQLLQQLSKGGIGTTLTGVVVFTARAESHQGFCHGGSMCSVLDDVIGWCAFMVTGCCRPWSGFTVQINTSLQKPIPVNSTLLVRAIVTKIERRKVSIEARLIDPACLDNQGEPAVHAQGDGLVVLNRGVLPLSTQPSLESWPSRMELS